MLTTFTRIFSLLIALGLTGSNMKGSPFTRIVSFGDSLADTGNLYQNSGGTVPPPELYYQGRVSDGIVWVEYLAAYLDADLDDYAYVGAKTDDTNYRDDDLGPYFYMAGFQDQVDQFLEDASCEKVSHRDIFTLVIGANDFFDFLTKSGPNPYPAAIENTLQGIQRLLEAGARTLIVLNVPDLSKTPAFAGLSEMEKLYLSGFCDLYNQALEEAVSNLVQAYKCRLVLFDMYAALNDMIASSAEYGLTNVETPAIYGGVPGATSLFWDTVHPTTVAHQMLACQVLDEMLDELVPGQAIGLELNVPGWVHP